MKITDFKKMTERHVEICKKIIEKEGFCYPITCSECPFFFENYFKFEDEQLCGRRSEILFKSAKEFIELYNNKDIKVDEKRSINLDMNMFTMEFGKMDVPTDKHFQKVYEEFNELNDANNDYAHDKIETDIHPSEKEEDRKNLCSEALDMIQASISFISHLIEEGIITNKDIEAWKEKLEKRKEKYLK
ncbi:hypothetical protein [Fusobacterium varium]